MEIVRSLEKLPHSSKGIILTIGNFDGVHLGHQAVLRRVQELSIQEQCPSVAITFENHPAEVVHPEQKICVLCHPQHKLKLLGELNLDVVLFLKFTKEFSLQEPETFLKSILDIVPINYLVLGHDATLGKNRSGDQQRVKKIAQTLDFQVEYLSPFVANGEVVSSSKVRTAIAKGDFQKAQQLLGRSYSIYGPVITGKTHGKKLGFPTANINVDKLCLPPFGVYAVQVQHKGRWIAGVANLGVAPTMRNDKQAVLEVHLFDWDEDLYGEEIDVHFIKFIRSEKRFGSVQELVAQIQNDIVVARETSRQNIV